MFQEKSFTLIETLVAIAIFAFAFGAVAGLVVMSYRVHGHTWQQSMAVNQARKGIETMVKEIREAQTGEDGSYPIELANDKEFVFYSDIDTDGDVERVRYFLGIVNSGQEEQECVAFDDGGSCSVIFSGFLQGELNLAQVQVSVEGDFGSSSEFAEIFADGIKIGEVCKTGCNDCPYTWQGTETFDAAEYALDDNVQFTAYSSDNVNDFCDWEEVDHAMKVKFKLSWTEQVSGLEHEFKKGITNPTGAPGQYLIEQEQVSVLTSYVRNVPPIFRYFDGDDQELLTTPARLKDTKKMKVYLIINVNPERAPQDFELESAIQLRNLKTNL